ncbi:MAG: 4-hydroxy-tetrahydrodipicolinate reductase [Fusobacteriaceae bacterium]
MEIIVHGEGAMGNVLADLIKNQEELFLTGFSSELKDETGDIIIDFSHPGRLETLLDYAVEKKIPLLIATTGYSEEISEKIQIAGRCIPILISTNTSIGVNIVNRILENIAPVLYKNFDIEIIEKHHNKKLDSPSGTAKTLYNTIKNSCSEEFNEVHGRLGNSKRDKGEIGIHAVRGGTVVGEHSILFAGEDEIIEIKHTALSKKIFAKGAIEAGKLLIKKSAGVYTMKDIY